MPPPRGIDPSERVGAGADGADEEADRVVGVVGRRRSRPDDQPARSRPTAPSRASGRSVNDARRGRRSDHQAEDQQRADDRARSSSSPARPRARNASSIRKRLTPRASATSGRHRGEQQRPVQDRDRERGRRRRATPSAQLVAADRRAPRRTAASRSAGAYSPLQAEEQRAEPEHQHERQRGRDVVAPAAAEQPDPERAGSENTPRPSSVLTPIRLAPAAPANEPFGIAWAANAEPRRTVKKPTTPRDDRDDASRRSRR